MEMPEQLWDTDVSRVPAENPEEGKMMQLGKSPSVSHSCRFVRPREVPQPNPPLVCQGMVLWEHQSGGTSWKN